MLVLGRQLHESIVIIPPNGGPRITVFVSEIRGATIRIGIDAPRDFTINRSEVQAVLDAAAGNPDGGRVVSK